MKELVFWHGGIAYGARSALQPPGSLKTAKNIDFGVEGDQTIRDSLTALNSAALDPTTIHSLRRFEDYALAGHGTKLSAAPISTGVFVTLSSSFTTGLRWRFKEYKRLLHCYNGKEEALFDEYGNLFPGELTNPDPPAAAAGAGGTLLAEKFMCYVSDYITFPNGMIYETGISDGTEVDCTAGSKQITWTVPVSTYAAYLAHAYHAFNKTLTLLHFNGAQNGTTITDSTGRHTWTAAGTAVIDNSWDTLGTNCILLDGDSDFVYAADHADFSTTLAAAAFTAHFRLKLDTLPAAGSSMGFFGQADATNRINGYMTNNGGSYEIHVYVNNAATIHHFHGVWTTPVVATEYHIAVIRGWGGVTNTDAGWAIAVNGTALTNVVDDSDPTVTIPDIGGNFEVGRCRSDASTVVGYVDGRIKEFVLMNVALWTANFTPPTEQSYDCSIRRKLYRGPGTGGTLADIYYVDTLYDNTTTAYTDNVAAATLLANGPCYVQDYGPGPHSNFIDAHYGRFHAIDPDKPWRLWYTEAASGETAIENESLIPMACLSDDWDDIRVSGFDKTEPMGLISWGTNFFIALKHTWIRRQGNDPDTWSYKKTWARHGVCAIDTLSIHKTGLIYLATNEQRKTGLALFNGQTSDMITTPKFDWIFNKDMDPDHASESRGICVGPYYHFLYQQVTTGDMKWVCFDLTRFPDIRPANWTGLCGAGQPTVMTAYNQGYDESNKFSLLVGGSDGKVYKDDPGTAVPFDIESKDLIGDIKIANDEKVLKEIRYNLDTNNEDVTLELYIDSAIATWADGLTYRTISGTADKVQVLRDIPQNFKGRFFRLRVYDDTGHLNIHIYSPWEIIFDPVT